jgi:hypothetical protein
VPLETRMRKSWIGYGARPPEPEDLPGGRGHAGDRRPRAAKALLSELGWRTDPAAW